MGTEEKKELKESIDYVFIEETDDFDKYNKLIYLKCLGKNNKYLGSYWIAILKDFPETETEHLIEEVLSLKCPKYEAYTIIKYRK